MWLKSRGDASKGSFEGLSGGHCQIYRSDVSAAAGSPSPFAESPSPPSFQPEIIGLSDFRFFPLP
jgi:hypothetical protein